jgi:hypothetical protein
LQNSAGNEMIDENDAAMYAEFEDDPEMALAIKMSMIDAEST